MSDRRVRTSGDRSAEVVPPHRSLTVNVPSTGKASRQGMGVRRTMAFGVIVIALFFGGFGVWAVLVPLESAVIAQGVLSVSGKRKTVQHLEGGIVTDILVEEGDTVAAGQPLITLDDTQAHAAFSLLQGQYDSAAALKARLEAERDGLAQIRYPEWLRQTAGEEETDDFLATQDRIFEARAQSITNQIAIYNQQIAQLREETIGLKEEIEAQDRQIELLNEEIGGIRTLVEKNLEGKQRLLALERRKAEIAGERANNKARIARVGQRIGETRLLIVEIGNARMNEVVAELREVETRMSELRKRKSTARTVLSRTRITAPVSGTVIGLRVFTRGGVIGRGDPLMHIVPAGDEFVIETRIEPTHIDTVSPDLSAQIRLTAFSHLTTPTLFGTVRQVSADRLIDEYTGVPYYQAQVVLDQEQPEFADLKLQPGMPAEIIILTGQRTAMDYLLKPIVASFGRALREQ